MARPKTAAEYIQATSRVGRDPERPGLVVTIFNVNKPRDRSHYERFCAFRETFYRSVEATSVTPFSPRALDKGFAGTLVGLTRQGWRTMTPPLGAMEILNERGRLDEVVRVLGDRAFEHNLRLDAKEKQRLKDRVRDRAAKLLDAWAKLARDQQQGGGVRLQYNQVEAGAAVPLLHNFLAPEVKNLPPEHVRMRFRANRSLRDVGPSVNLAVRTLQNQELEEEIA